MLPPSIKSSVMQKVDALRKEAESKKRQLANMKVQVERNDLFAGAAVCSTVHRIRHRRLENLKDKWKMILLQLRGFRSVFLSPVDRITRSRMRHAQSLKRRKLVSAL